MEPRKQRKLALSNSADNPLSEREIVEATVAFANGATLEIKGLVSRNHDGAVGDKLIEDQIAFGMAMTKKGPYKFRGMVLERPRYNTVVEYMAAARETVKDCIWASLRDPAEVAKELVSREGWRGGIRVKASMQATGGGLRLTHHYEFETAVDLVQLGVVLLLDEGRSFRSKLCECRYSKCGLFFFEIKPPTGRPQRRYCSPTHLELGHNEQGAGRMKRKRRAPRKPK